MTDHEKALRAAQEGVDAIRPKWDGALGERRRAVLHARADGVTIYRIAQILDVSQGAVRQILGLTPPTTTQPAAAIPACWESRDSRATLGGISATWPQGGTEVVCWDDAPCPDAVCSREKGHTGRHMASLGPGMGHRIIAAWPGTHRPRKADLS